MTRYLQILAFVLAAFAGATAVQADDSTITFSDKDSIFVYIPDGRLDVYPPSLVKKTVDNESQFIVTTTDDVAHAYNKDFIDSVSRVAPKNMPTFTSFKFNNKFNGQVYEDVQCEIGAEGLITGSVPAIGKWLTPSFQRSDDEALVYIGRQLQHSKVSRRSFAEPVEYVVTRPGWQIMTISENPAEPDDPDNPDDPDDPDDPTPQIEELDKNAQKIELTAAMLSTNAPTMRSEEDLPSLIDGSESTFFHSTWSGSGYEPLPLDSCPWIEIELPEAIHQLQFRYETRNADSRWPLALRIDASRDGENWKQVQEFTSETDGLPEGQLQWWTSPVMDLGGDYAYLRVVCTQAAYKNYLCMAELELYNVTSLFSNNKLYTLTCKRGGLVLNEKGTGLAAGQTRTDAPEDEKRFAIINVGGSYYLYSPVNKRYLLYSNEFVRELGTPIIFDDSHADGDYTYMLSTQNPDGQTLYFNNNGNIVINSWDKPDDGNRWIIEAVDSFDPTEALRLAGVNGGGGDSPDPDPDQPSDEGKAMDFQPFGTRYTVTLDWPADRAVGVPTVYITTDSGRKPYDRTTFLSGTITIDGAGLFPDMEETYMQIRGRGNSSWDGENGKSPYRIKFDTKQKPFGLTKGKNWVLLANKQTGSMMSNAIGMKVAQLAGAAGANHIVPVELYINGEYRGSYNFTEKVSLSNNSIDLPDESMAAMLELDSYYDETYKFRGSQYNMPLNIKKPEFGDENPETLLTQQDIEDDWNELLEAVHNGDDISYYAEVDTLSAFYLTNELILNQELMHPKSTFVYKERVGDFDDTWKFGPVWDLDWAFGYEGSSRYYQSGATDDFTTRRWMECNQFWIDLRNAGETFDRAYYKAWTRFLRSGAMEELSDFCQEYFDYANSSFVHNAEKWYGEGRNYASQVEQARSWLTRRAEYVYGTLNEYDLSEELPEDTLWAPYVDSEVFDDVDSIPYVRLRDAIQNVMAKNDVYSCEPTALTALESVIKSQNSVVARAKTNAKLRGAIKAVLAGFTTWLADESMVLHQPMDLTEVYIVNPSPVENVEGWDCTVEPHTFDPDVTHTLSFLKQPGAQMSQQAALLPAGTLEWSAVALTRKGGSSYLFAGEDKEQIVEVSSRSLNSLAEARAWFDAGNGRNVLTLNLEKPEGRELGLHIEEGSGDHWTVISEFQLQLTRTLNTKSYQLSYVIDGKVYKTEEVPYGQTVTPEIPEAPEGYSFAGWQDVPETMPAHDVTVTGSFVVNQYTIAYVVNGETYKTESLSYGTTITSPSAPEAPEGYSFAGWQDVPETMPSHDVTVTGSFVVSQYTITYVIDGETYKTERVDYGSTITPPDVPEREGYPFAWEEYPEVMPAHDITIVGSYLTAVAGLRDEDGEQMIFSVDGKRLSRLQRGVNIVRKGQKTYRVVVK